MSVKYQNKMIVLTGASGYVGGNLLEHYDRLGKPLTVIGRSNSLQTLQTNAHKFYFDLGSQDLEELNKIEISSEPIFIHCAARNGGSLEECWSANVLGTKNSLQIAANNKASLFIHFSTGGVYGYKKGELVSEEEPLNPFNPYSSSKIIAEQIVRMYAQQYGMKCVILRLYFPYGGTKQNGIFKFVPDCIQSYQKLTINLGGAPKFTPIHVEDICEIVDSVIAQSIGKEDKSIETYNLCGDDVVSFLDVVRLYSSKLNIEPLLEFNKIDMGDLMGDNQKIKTALGWKQRHHLEDILQVGL